MKRIINPKDPLQSIPSLDSLESIIEELNKMTKNHKKQPCADPTTCKICFYASNISKSDSFLEITEAAATDTLGPLAELGMVSMANVAAFATLFYLLGMISEQRQTQDDQLGKMEESMRTNS